MTPGDPADFAWSLYTELRKELVESQKLRTQVIGVKVTFVSAAAGLIAANRVDPVLLVVPAFAAVFFDLLISSYSFSIKRIGAYNRGLERLLAKASGLDQPGSRVLLWQEYLRDRRTRQPFATVGNLGLTLLAAAAAAAALFSSRSAPWTTAGLGAALALFVGLDLFVFLRRWDFPDPAGAVPGGT